MFASFTYSALILCLFCTVNSKLQVKSDAKHVKTWNPFNINLITALFVEIRSVVFMNGGVGSSDISPVVTNILSAATMNWSIPLYVSSLEFSSKAYYEGERTSPLLQPLIFVFIAKNENELICEIERMQIKYPQWNSRSYSIIVLVSPSIQICHASGDRQFFNLVPQLWKKLQLVNMIVLHKVANSSAEVYSIYDPFSSTSKCFSNFSLFQSFVLQKRIKGNLQGWTFRVSAFKRWPTAVLKEQLNNVGCYKNMGGLDGLILSVVAEYMNFTSLICEPQDHLEYGFLYENGSYSGSLGDVLYQRAEVAFNGRFIKSYGSDGIEFTDPFMVDHLCVAVPKAGQIPKWLSISLALTFKLKVALLTLFILSTLFLYLLKKLSDNGSYQLIFQRSISDTVFELMQVFIAKPLSNFPLRTPQGIFVLSCMLFSVIVVSVFQGKVVTVITQPLYYQDINSLQELDESGLLIGTGSKNLEDSFSNEDDILMRRLRQKVIIIPGGNLIPNMIWNKTKLAALVRKSNAGLEITRHEELYGSKSVHIIDQCPRMYFLAYILRRGSPFTPHINTVLGRLLQAGLVKRWHAPTGISVTRADASNEHLKVFSLSDLQLAFYLLMTGILLGTTVFVFEIQDKIFCSGGQRSL